MAGCACAHHHTFTAGCTPCRRLDAAYNRRRRRAILAGTWQHRVPVDQIRSHLTALRADGMSLRAIATAAKLSHRTVIGITSRRHVQGPTAAAVLAVTPTHATLPAGMVDATGTTRRIRALVALGYPLSHIAAHLRRHLQQVWEWTWAKQATVTTTTATTVAACYERLSALPPRPGPGTSRARNLGRRQGWAPPMAYDDESIDDPSPEVDILARQHVYTRWDPFEERFWGRIQKTDTCWLWTGRLDQKGYGRQIGRERRKASPHRFAYELMVAPVPKGLTLDHLCRVRHCVNPAHLEPVTAAENTRRGADARWFEQCRNGHPAQIYRRAMPSGKNTCTECRRLADARRYERNHDRRLADSRARYAVRRSTVDDVLVQRVLAGHTPGNSLNPVERAEAVRIGSARGLSNSALARLLAANTRTIRALAATHQQAADTAA